MYVWCSYGFKGNISGEGRRFLADRKQEEERVIRVKAGGPGEMHNDNATAKCRHANDDRVQLIPFSSIHLCAHVCVWI